MTYLAIHKSFFSQKALKTPSAKVNSPHSPLKDSVIGQNTATKNEAFH